MAGLENWILSVELRKAGNVFLMYCLADVEVKDFTGWSEIHVAEATVYHELSLFVLKN